MFFRKKEGITEEEVRMFKFFFGLARAINVDPKKLAYSIVETTADHDYVDEFTEHFATATTKHMLEQITKKKSKK